MTTIDNSLSLSPVTTMVVPAPGHLPRLDQYSFFQALRQIERERSSQPRIGYAMHPADEPVRIGQPAELNFAPATFSAASSVWQLQADSNHTSTGQGRATSPPIALQQRFLGLLGPAGPMPLHFTETVRDRQRHAGDASLQAFLDIFHHRTATLFYRAWSDAQPIVQHDRPGQDNFARFLGALVGATNAKHGARDSALGNIQRFHVGQFAGVHRHAEGLASVLTRSLRASVRIQPFALRTLALAPESRSWLCSYPRGTRSRLRTNCLGQSAQLGTAVPDRSSLIDIAVGPLSYERFQQFLPGGPARELLTKIVQLYAGPTLDARVTLQLQSSQTPRVVLGQSGQLGRTGWLGRPSADATIRDDYRFEVSGAVLAETERGAA